MKRHLSLVKKMISNLYKISKLSFIALIIVQIVVSFGYIFFYTTAFQNRAQYISGYEDVRKISIEFDNNENFPQNKLINTIENNDILTPEDVQFIFEDKMGNPYISYLYLNNHNEDVEGKSISQSNIDNDDKVIVVSIDRHANPFHENEIQQVAIGDKIKVNDNDFDIIGLRYVYFNELPYSVAFKNLKLVCSDIIFPKGVTELQKKKLKDYFEDNLSHISVNMPTSVAQETFQKLFLMFLCSIFSGIISVITFGFIFKYLIDKTKKMYSINRICGATTKYNIFLITEMFILLFTLSYIVSIAIFKILQITVHMQILSNVTLKIHAIVFIYLAFVVLIIAMIIPYAISFIKKTIKEGCI